MLKRGSELPPLILGLAGACRESHPRARNAHRVQPNECRGWPERNRRPRNAHPVQPNELLTSSESTKRPPCAAERAADKLRKHETPTLCSQTSACSANLRPPPNEACFRSLSAARSAAQGGRFLASGCAPASPGTRLAAQGGRFVLSDGSPGTHRQAREPGGELTASLKQTVRSLISVA